MNPFRTLGRGVLATALGLALITPQTALANGDAIWKECVAGNGVTTSHSQGDFQDAITNPPADGAEYTDCLDQIRSAQLKAASGSTSGSGSGGGASGGAAGGSGTGTGTGGGAAATVPPAELQQALTDKGIDPAAPAGTPAPAPAPTEIAGEKIDLESDRLPSIANALSLPLPLAASAVVVMFSAALPVVRFAVGRFGAPQTGTTPSL